MEFNNRVIWNLQPGNLEFDARVIYDCGGRQVTATACKSHSVTSAPQASSKLIKDKLQQPIQLQFSTNHLKPIYLLPPLVKDTRII